MENIITLKNKGIIRNIKVRNIKIIHNEIHFEIHLNNDKISDNFFLPGTKTMFFSMPISITQSVEDLIMLNKKVELLLKYDGGLHDAYLKLKEEL